MSDRFGRKRIQLVSKQDRKHIRPVTPPPYDIGVSTLWLIFRVDMRIKSVSYFTLCHGSFVSNITV